MLGKQPPQDNYIYIIAFIQFASLAKISNKTLIAGLNLQNKHVD